MVALVHVAWGVVLSEHGPPVSQDAAEPVKALATASTTTEHHLVNPGYSQL